MSKATEYLMTDTVQQPRISASVRKKEIEKVKRYLRKELDEDEGASDSGEEGSDVDDCRDMTDLLRLMRANSWDLPAAIQFLSSRPVFCAGLSPSPVWDDDLPKVAQLMFHYDVEPEAFYAWDT